MARNDRGNNRTPNTQPPADLDDERLVAGTTEPQGEISEMYGEAILPLIIDDELPAGQQYRQPVAGDGRYARDDSDRETQNREFDEREMSDEERLEMFRMSLFNNQLPDLPNIPGWHCCYLTTVNPRDPISGRIRLGYEILSSDNLPGYEHAVLQSGPYAGYIGVNEMVAAKLPLRLYEMYMTEAHHNQPNAEEGKLRATLDAIKQQGGAKAPIILEQGMQELGTRPRVPRFEGMAPRG